MLILIGTDDALLEGLAQLLAGAGHKVQVAHSVADAEEMATQAAPLLVVIDRDSVASDSGEAASRIPLASGGAFVLYRTTSDQGGASRWPTESPARRWPTSRSRSNGSDWRRSRST